MNPYGHHLRDAAAIGCDNTSRCCAIGSGVSDLAALVLEEQGGTLRVLDHASAVREAVHSLSVLYGLDQRGGRGLPSRTTVTGVRARHLPLGNSHDVLFPGCVSIRTCRPNHVHLQLQSQPALPTANRFPRWAPLQPRSRAAHRTRDRVPGSPGDTQAETVVQALPRLGAEVQDPRDHREPHTRRPP